MKICFKNYLHDLNALYESKNSWESKSLDPLMQMVLDPPTFKKIHTQSKKRIPIMEQTLKIINIQQFNSSRVRKHFHDLAAAGYDVSLHPDTFYVIRWSCYVDPKYNLVKQSKRDARWDLSFLKET
jgi:hypothetical protein